METLSKPSRWPLIALGIAALVAVVVGAASMFTPVSFALGNGTDVAGDVNAMSEMRAAGGAILLAAAIMLAGLVRSRLRPLAMSVATLLFLGYGGGRAFAVLIDGVPHSVLLVALAAEIAVGLVMAAALRTTLRAQSQLVAVR